MSTLINLNDEVEINQSNFIAIDQTWIERIKAIAKNNGSGKYRTCIHNSEDDNVHEMLIVHCKNTYVRPHKHRRNGESLQFIEGTGTAIVFNNEGKIKKSFRVGGPSSGETFYYSMIKGLFHMLIIDSEFLVFKETTRGPFIREDTIFPNWAPDGKDKSLVDKYFYSLNKKLEIF